MNGNDKQIKLIVLAAAGAAVLALLALWAGYALGRGGKKPSEKPPREVAEKKVRFWTCAMHPAVNLPGPGLCPRCPMNLVPVYEGGDDGGERRLVMSEAARKLAEIQTTRVERRFVEAEVRLVGKVGYDQTRVRHVAARFPGRLDRLYVDYAGIPVREGDHLVYIYSPELLAAQEELLQAKRAYEGARQGKSEFMLRSSKATLEATREKLRLWGLTAKQVEAVEKSGKVSEHMTVHSPMAGIVIEKHLNQGDYVKTGSRIYTLADLSRLWVNLDAYESDLEWLRYGQDVEFRTEAYPGRAFRGTVSFIDPVVDSRTRTVRLRVIADNADGALKPGMFVHATVRPRLAVGGRVMDPRLAGKWICPMHPEVVKDGPGKCDECEMPLVTSEEMGYAAATEGEAPLIIPASAPLVTGRRAVVYVEVPDAERPTFEGREVVLGPRAGDFSIVEAGLREGEMVVSRGAFKVDSALQIEAKPSMMSPTGSGGTGMHHGGHEGSGSKSREPAEGGN